MPKYLFHTTSLPGLLSIMGSHSVQSEAPFVSFSEIPHVGDISHNDVVIVFKHSKLAPQLLQVDYTEDWYNKHPEQAAYVAGEGWLEQFIYPEECIDKDGFEDEECMEEAYKEGEISSFLFKSDEREWVSKEEDHPVTFDPEAVDRILVVDERQVDAVKGALEDANFDLPVDVRQAGVRVASPSLPSGAGFLFTDGIRILLLKRSIDNDEAGTWGIPGGGVYNGETPQDGALRECMEEIGSVPPHRILDWFVFQCDDPHFGTFEYTTFLAQVEPAFVEGFLPVLDHESTGWGWYDEEGVKALTLHPGLDTLFEHTTPFFQHIDNRTAQTEEELQKLPIDVLDRMAFGVVEGVQELPVGDIKIKYADDYNNAVAEIEEGLWEGNESALEEPVEVSLERGIYWLEDGHHRYVMARGLGRDTILADLSIKDNPVRALMRRNAIEESVQLPRTIRYQGATYQAVTAGLSTVLLNRAVSDAQKKQELRPYVDLFMKQLGRKESYKKNADKILSAVEALLMAPFAPAAESSVHSVKESVKAYDHLQNQVNALEASMGDDPQEAISKIQKLFDDFYAETLPKVPAWHKAFGETAKDLLIEPGLLPASARMLYYLKKALKEAERLKLLSDEGEEVDKDEVREALDEILREPVWVKEKQKEEARRKKEQAPAKVQQELEGLFPTKEKGKEAPVPLTKRKEEAPVPLVRRKKTPPEPVPAKQERVPEPQPVAEGGGFLKLDPAIVRRLVNV